MKDQTTTTNLRTGARLLVDQLVAQGIAKATCVPGESYLSVLDALRDSGIDLLTCRQESGAAMMAEAHGKLTGRPGICFVTRGPGATNAAAGVHIAMQDSTPMILFVGQIERKMRHREAFQELDYSRVFGGLAKWVVDIEDASRIPELVSRAFRVAMQGRPGPVVVALPEDMLDDQTDAKVVPRFDAPVVGVGDAPMQALGDKLAVSKSPVMILGGSGWSATASDGVQQFAEAWQLPVAVSYRRTGLFPATHPCYIGDLSLGPNPDLIRTIREADLVILMSTRLGEIASQGYTLIDVPRHHAQLVHIHSDPDELGRVYQPDLAIVATPDGMSEALASVRPESLPPGRSVAAARASYEAWSETPRTLPGAFQWGEVVCWLRDTLPDDAIITHGAGNFAAWVHRHYRLRTFNAYLAPTSGSMGYGLPAGIMAKRLNPERIVVTVAGDGDLMMTAQEFATAVHHDVPLIVVVVDNGIYGTIRMHQERAFPGRIAGTTLTNPDFADWARAHGAFGARVTETASFAPAFEAARASGKPALIHCRLDPEAISPGADLSHLARKK